jgi:predicted DNA-binding ribbon-helix-helix protein
VRADNRWNLFQAWYLISTIDKERPFANLSSAIRLFVLHHYRDKFQKLPKHMVAPEGEPSDKHLNKSLHPARSQSRCATTHAARECPIRKIFDGLPPN